MTDLRAGEQEDVEVAGTLDGGPGPAQHPGGRTRAVRGRIARIRMPSAWRERTDWVPLDSTLGQVLRGLRLGLLAAYVPVVAICWSVYGVPFGRLDLLLWIAVGLVCASVGRHPVWMLWVVLDIVPFAAVLVVYDHLRGWSDTVGLPTWWQPQVEAEKFLFGGVEPTVWLQEHLRYPGARWWDVLACACYFSFFFLPYVMAGVMWLRSRRDFYRWTLRFVTLSFVGFGFFVLLPSAPPWAAARCTAAQVASHPNNPACMYDGFALNSVLGTMPHPRPGTDPFVERIVTRGFGDLHLTVATTLLDEGRVQADAVAAMPSLHLGGIMLFVLFLWPRVRRWWRPVLVAYPLLMTFSLVYTGEHYVVDCLGGALVALLVHLAANRVERRWQRRARNGAPALDTLETPS